MPESLVCDALRGVSPRPSRPPAPAEGLQVGSPAYRRASWALFLGGFTTFLLLYNLQPLLPLLAESFGLGATLASGAVSAATLALALALIPAALLADRIGRKPLMGAALLLATLLTLGAALARGFDQLLVLRALLGLSLAGLPAVAMTYLSEEFEPAALGRAMGLYISGNALGGLCGRFFAAQIAEHADWRVALGVLGACSALTALAFWRLLPASRHFQPSRQAFGRLPGQLRDIFADPGLRRLFALGFLLMGCFTSLYNYLGFRLVEAPFSLTAAQIGAVFLLYLVGILASNLAVRLVERWGRAGSLQGMVALMAAGLALTLSTALGWVILGVGLFTFGFFAAHALAASWVGRRPVTARALAAALYLCSYYLGASLVGSLSGLAWQAGGWAGVGVCLGAGLALCGLICARLRRVM